LDLQEFNQTNLNNYVYFIVGYGGGRGTDSLGVDERVRGRGHSSLGERVGGTTFFKVRRKKILPFDHFGTLLGQRLNKKLKNRSNRLFGTILVTFCDFLPFLPFFADFRFFSTYRVIFGKGRGYLFFGREGGAPVNSDFSPILDFFLLIR
jgi:hypothetical protein